jgi:phosphoribosyl-dephospho-CoA transferase
MDILKRAKEHGENIVVVGATGPGNVTTVDSLSELFNRGHAGVWTSFASSNIEQLREIECDAVMGNTNIKIVASPNF